MRRGLWRLAFVFLFSACVHKKDPKLTEHKTMGPGKTSIVVPGAIWKTIEAQFDARNTFKSGGGDGEGESETKEEGEKKLTIKGPHSLKVNKEEMEALLKKHPATENFPIHATLVEKTDGVLGGKNYLLDFPAGGGTLDLSYFVTDGVKGSFYLKIYWDKEQFPDEDTKIYFASRSKILEIDGMKLGSGCSDFFDLTKYWIKNMKGEGLFLNTTHNRHISLLAGNYYFVVFKNGKIYEALLEILDSRHRDLMCVPE